MSKSLIILCACFCLARPVLAWNAEGHMVVAQIAYKHLDPEVKAKCDMLIAVNLGSFTSASSSNFVTAAVWADDFKSQLGTGIQHYIDLYFSLDGTTVTNTTPVTNVVWAINQCIATLQDPTATTNNQATALRYLLHFVGDIQQPLHCSSAVWASNPDGDAGGNEFSLGGGWGQLHSLWDSGGGYLSDSVSSRYSASTQTILSNKAAACEAAYPYTFSIGSIPDPMDWAIEGQGLAQTVSYVGITLGSTPSSAASASPNCSTRSSSPMPPSRLLRPSLPATLLSRGPPFPAEPTVFSGTHNPATPRGTI
jgi:hypothetical protein